MGHPIGQALPKEAAAVAPDSFSTFYADNHRSVIKLAYVIAGGGWQVAEDIAQEAFVRALDRWDGQLVAPEAWVRTTAVNLARSRLRRLRAEHRALARTGVDADHGGPVDLPEEASRLWQLVHRLPRRQAQAVALHYADDLPINQVATIKGCAEGTVKAVLHQGRRRIAEQLDRTAGGKDE